MYGFCTRNKLFPIQNVLHFTPLNPVWLAHRQIGKHISNSSEINIFVKASLNRKQMNRYLRSGLIYLSLGLLLGLLGYYLMEQDIALYRWVMIVGFIVFGFGFLLTIYALIRKIERRSFLRSRRERQDQDHG